MTYEHAENVGAARSASVEGGGGRRAGVGAARSASVEGGGGRRAGLRIALDYHRAWTGGDFEKAMTYISDEIRVQAPAGELVGAAAFRDFMGPFSQICKKAELLAAYGEGDSALLMYNTETVPVASAPGAEWITVADGRIVRMRIIFDRLPFAQARQDGTHK